MKTQSAKGVLSKHLPALIGFAFILGFTHASAWASPAKFELVITGPDAETESVPVVSFNYTGASSNNTVTAKIVVDRYVDTFSQTFLLDQFTGTSLGAVTLKCTQFNAEAIPTATLVYKMNNTQIISEVEEGSGDKPQEEITFGFSAISFTYTPQ
jgi:type VI protein secretion system component Hcp